MNDAATWLALAVSAFATADGAVGFGARAESFPDGHQCWRAEAPAATPRHADQLSRGKETVGCVQLPAAVTQRCADWRVAVVRDLDGSMMVSAEADDGGAAGAAGAGDQGQQRLAAAVRDPLQRAEILALWPPGAWNQLRLCDGEESIEFPIAAPFRCQVLHPDGKPVPMTFGRGAERRCAVALGGYAGALVSAAGTGSAGMGVELIGNPPLPASVPPGGTARFEIELAGEARSAWHVPVTLTSVAVGSAAHRVLLEDAERRRPRSGVP